MPSSSPGRREHVEENSREQRQLRDEHIETLRLRQPELVRRVREPAHPDHVRVPPRPVQPGQHGRVLPGGRHLPAGRVPAHGGVVHPRQGLHLPFTWDGADQHASQVRPPGTRPARFCRQNPAPHVAGKPDSGTPGLSAPESPGTSWKPKREHRRLPSIPATSPSSATRRGLPDVPGLGLPDGSSVLSAVGSPTLGQVVAAPSPVTGAKPFCAARPRGDNSHLTYVPDEEVGRIRWDRPSGRTQHAAFAGSAYSMGLVRTVRNRLLLRPI